MANEGQHEGLRGAMDKAEDAVGAAVGMASASTAGSHSTKAFVMNAVIANRYEIEAARIALARSRSEPVRQLAQRMIDDHTRVGDQMRRAVEAGGQAQAMPDALDDRRKGMIDNLRTAPEDEFDRRYLQQQDAAHREAITLFEGYGKNGDDPRLKRLAEETAPALKAHLEAVKAAQGH